jgi:hypothetical protein
VFWQGKEELGFIWKSYLETAGHLVDMVQWDDQGKPNALMPSQVAEWQARLVQLKQPLLVSNFKPAKGLPALLLQDVQLSGWLLVSPSEDAAPSTFVWAGKPEEPAEPYLWITQINHHEIISI